ncbi:MAG: hypothetical protein K8U03_25015 [Planctomycetia bacterium]|nr:hypothetical protein [Planctomycetia bacterium]
MTTLFRLDRSLIATIAFLLWSSSLSAADFAFRSGDELIVQIPQLDQLRQVHKKLNGTIRLNGAGGEKIFKVNLADRLLPEALVIDVRGYGACASVALEVKNGEGNPVLSERVDPVPVVTTPGTLPMPSGRFAAIESGSQLEPAATPRIALPDVAAFRMQKLVDPARTVTSGEITYPVITDVDLPGSGSVNAVIVSRQSFAPDDATKCSLYFSYRKPLFDEASTKLKEWRKMLVEVPLDRAWLDKQGDEVITLPLDKFAIHTTEERELHNKRWNAPEGYNMLGGSSTGLYQGGQTVEVDDQGRIYITNVPDGAGIVRFNPHTGKFEQPPVSFGAGAHKFLPTDAGWNRTWDADLGQVVCTRGRVYIVFDRNYRVNTPNGNFETCNGVVSVPQENWHDAEAFRRDIRLHAACWPQAQFPMYADEVKVGAMRRVGPPTATKHGLTFGTFRLDLDAAGNTERLAVIKTIEDKVDAAGKPLPPTEAETIKGLQRQRFINVGGAGRQFVRQQYGEFAISRAALALTMPDAPAERIAGPDGRYLSTFAGAPTGELTIRFDITTKLKSDPQRYGTVAASMSGVSQGPAYAVIPIPGEADQAIGVCEYNYFFSKLDFSRRAADRKVYKSYLTQTVDGRKTGFPVGVGLGPYNATWVEHDDASWLYMMGYTGMARLKYAEAGRPVDAYAVESFHAKLSPKPIDGVARDNVKDFLHIFPTTDGRLIDIGRGRPARGGGARSAGLELFDPRTLGTSRTAVEMNRCFGLYTPVSRVMFSTSGAAPRQEIFVAGGNIRPEYVADIEDPTQRPKNQDPKIFVYDCASGGDLRDLYGFSLPALPEGQDASSNIVFSPCRQFLVAMQGGGTVLTYSVAQRRFVDGIRLRNSADQPIVPLSYGLPSAWIWSAPNGRIFFQTALDGELSKSVNFYEVRIARDGRIAVVPHLAVALETGGRGARDFDHIVRCFLPDLKKQDGSYDFVLGSERENGGQPLVRVIDDFVLPLK